MCDWTLIIFQDSFALHYLMSTLFLFLKKKNFFVGVYFNTNNFEFFFHVSHVPHVSAMLDLQIFFYQARC